MVDMLKPYKDMTPQERIEADEEVRRLTLKAGMMGSAVPSAAMFYQGTVRTYGQSLIGAAKRLAAPVAVGGGIIAGTSMYAGTNAPGSGQARFASEALKSVWPLGGAAGQGMFIGEESSQAAAMAFFMASQAKSRQGMEFAHKTASENVAFQKTAISAAEAAGTPQVLIDSYKEFLRVSEDVLKTQEQSMAYYNEVTPKIKEYTAAQDKAEKVLKDQTKTYQSLMKEQAGIPGQISELGAGRFGVGAQIGGMNVGSELGGMERVWELQKAALNAQRAKLSQGDVYSTVNALSASERMAGAQANVGIAAANLGYVSAAEGSGAKDRAIVGLQKLRAEEQLRSASSSLQIEQEKQKAIAADTAGKAYEEAANKLAIANIDMQLSYGDMHKQVEFFIARHEDMAQVVPASVQTVEDAIKNLWTRQKQLDTEIPNMAKEMDKSQESITAYSTFLRDLRDNGVDYLNAGLEQLKRNLRDVDNRGSNFRNWQQDNMSIDYSLSERT